MKKNRKKNKIKRYFTVTKRKAKRLNRKKIFTWFKRNLKQHPFVLGLLCFILIHKALVERGFAKFNLISVIIFHLYLFILWLILVVSLNLLKDKQKVKWYLKKRFVFSMLVIPGLTPLGLILLWTGSKFKKVTKIVLSIIFGLYLVIKLSDIAQYEKMLNKSTFERIVETITEPKKKILLKTLNKDILDNLRITRISKQERVKLAISDIASQYSSSIVSIQTKDKNGRELGMGSGFVISSDGLIVTNFHVIESAYDAEVKIGKSIFKEVYFVKDIPNLDIAILKVNATNLPVLPVGDSDSLINGQFVIVLSNPWGLERSVSSGIISAIRSKDDIKLIQMTAPVSPGSSGGPVINEYGEVVGITTLASFFMAQNLNFAIPINYLNKIIVEK